MSGEKPAQAHYLEVQRLVTRLALDGLASFGFALAGSGAIREHGIIDRPTEDVDLFTTVQDEVAFRAAVEMLVAALGAGGFQVEKIRSTPQFARLHVHTADGAQVDLDLGVDWRHDDPVNRGVGPVLSLIDAVGNKVSALYGRGEPRDYLDVDSIRASGRFSDDELIASARERDPGFDLALFAEQLEAAGRITQVDVARYGLSMDQLATIKGRCKQWAQELRGPR